MIISDTCGPPPLRMDTSFNSLAEYDSCHSAPILLASLPDCGIPQSSPYTPLSVQPESLVL